MYLSSNIYLENRLAWKHISNLMYKNNIHLFSGSKINQIQYIPIDFKMT